MAAGSASDLTPRVPKPTTTLQRRVYRCVVIVGHALLPVRAGMSDECRSELIRPMNQQGCV
jgi:hypothetical protein